MLKLNVKYSFEKIGPLPIVGEDLEGCASGVNPDFADEAQIARSV